MVEFTGIRDKHTLVPATAFDLEQLERLRPGRPIRVEATFSRSLQHNRWYRKLVSVVAEALDLPPGLLHSELKFKAGLVLQIFRSQEFGVAVQLKSTAFKSMDESEFTEFVRTATEILFRDYLPGQQRDVYQRVSELLGEPCPW